MRLLSLQCFLALCCSNLAFSKSLPCSGENYEDAKKVMIQTMEISKIMKKHNIEGKDGRIFESLNPFLKPYKACLGKFVKQLNKATPADCVHSDKEFNCVQYVSNYDADTITFNIPKTHSIIGHNMKIRVNGVDTPELRTKNHCEKKASKIIKKQVAEILAGAKRINLKNIKRGKYFRLVADVDVDGQDLKSIILTSKLAYPYDGGTKQKIDWCSRLKQYQTPASDKGKL